MRMTGLVRLAALATMVVAMPLGAQKDKYKERERDRDRDRDYGSTLDTLVRIGRGGTVDLSAHSGDIEVVGWNDDQVKVHAETENGSLRFSASGTRLSLEVHQIRGRIGETRFQLSVPVGTRVIMQGTSGDLSVSGTRGDVHAETHSGDISITDAAEEIDFESMSGDVDVRNASGVIRGETLSGTVDVRGAKGEVDIETVSGEITLSGVQSKYVSAESVSGEILYEGTIDVGGRYEFSSHSGDVTISVPSSLDATVNVETFSGSINSDFPMVLNPGERHGKQFEFKIGNGGARVDVSSFSGTITIERGTGRAPPRE